MNLTDKIFTDADAARAHLESLQWADGRVCPHCGTVDNSVELKGKSTRPGVYKCRDCRKPFSVTVGTLFERSHVPLNKWVLAVHLLSSSKKGMSSHQLMRSLGVTYKTAWFMAHRIREAMRDDTPFPMGGEGTPVEVDEAFIGFDPDHRPEPGQRIRTGMKMKVLSLVDRESGRAKSYVVDNLQISTLFPILNANIAREARVMTDAAAFYKSIFWRWNAHGVVNHQRDEYVSPVDTSIHTNTIEGYFSIFKRGMRGVYQHCAKRHLHRYLAEFDFRYTNRMALGIDDTARAAKVLSMITGKRLTYRRTDGLTCAA
ncbi:IS1595 family transposase [Brevundimonas sp.]|uniref:IS1595 family transposase n=1 Tax=Brevundimonas sp. TaxID=1871086 RepID=UPI002FCB7B44